MPTAETPLLHALSIEPRSARAGESVVLRFATRNIGTRPSPPGTVTFAPDDGLELGDATSVDVASAGPGEEIVAEARARVVGPLRDRTALTVRAVLRCGDRVLTTNVCRLVVRSRPVLDGPASGTFTEALGAETVRVRAVVVNEGDGPAFAARLSVPPPAGCEWLDTSRTDGALEIERLDPGERREVQCDARIVQAVRAVRAKRAIAAWDGGSAILPVRQAVVPAATLAPLDVAVHASRRRVAVTVHVRNEGWAEARDVRLRFMMPPGVVPIHGTASVDGVPIAVSSEVPATRKRRGAGGTSGRRSRAVRDETIVASARIDADGDARVITVAAIAARGEVRIAFDAAFGPSCEGGTISVTAAHAGRDAPHAGGEAPHAGRDAAHGARDAADGARDAAHGGQAEERHAEVPFVVERRHDVQVRIVEAPAAVAPGDPIAVVARVENCGDLDESLAFHLTGAAGSSAAAAGRTLPPGTTALVEITTVASREPAASTTLPLAFVVSDPDGECVRTECSVRVDEPRSGASDDIVTDGASALRGGSADAPAGDRDVRVSVRAPDSVTATVPFAVEVEIVTAAERETLTLIVPDVANTAYVAGSASVDGHPLLDRIENRSVASPLAGRGLVLHDVPADCGLTVSWSLVPSASVANGTLIIAPVLHVDGMQVAVETARCTIMDRDHFAVRTNDMPYHTDAGMLFSAPLGDAPERVIAARSSSSFDARPSSLIDTHRSLPNDVRTNSPIESAPGLPLHTPSARAHALTNPLLVTPVVPVAETFGGVAEGVSPALRLDGDRIATLRRSLDARADGLVRHLLALPVFVPDPDAFSGDPTVAGRLATMREAVQDVFDRLYVKLRIPAFEVSSDDLEDCTMRQAALAFFEALCDVQGAEPAAIRDALPPARLDAIVCALREASYGAPVVLRALITLIPPYCDGDGALGAAVRSFATCLDHALSRYEGVPLEVFDEALAHRDEPALEAARAELLAAVRAASSRAEALC